MRTYKVMKLVLALALLGCQQTAQVETRKVAPVAKPQITQVPWALDCTNNLQEHLDVGGIVTVPNVGKDWVTRPLYIRKSNTTLRLEAGVTLVAQRGADGFRAKGACLISLVDVSNVTISGAFATLRGWRLELTDVDQVEHSEWRHGLQVLSSSRVTIEGLRIENFGGDGIYIGGSGVPCSSIHIRNVVCAGNYRQGMSVIAGVGVLVEDCVFRDTRGNPPQAGIDIEPNNVHQQLLGIVVRRCLAEGNNGAGFQVNLQRLNPDSPRVSITFQDCLTRNNRRATPVVKAANGLPIDSCIEFKCCTFLDEPWPDAEGVAEFPGCKWIQPIYSMKE